MADALRYLTRVFLLLGSLGLLAQTQSPSAHAQTSTATRPVRFTVFSARTIENLAFVPRAGVPPQTLVFQPTARSTRQEYRGPMPLRFVDTRSGAVVAEANIPPEIGDALLLFTPLETTKSGSAAGIRYQIAVLDDSATRHGAGGLAIINLSGLSLAGTVNAEPVTLKPGLNPMLLIGRGGNVRLTTSFKNRKYQAHASTVTLARDQRALLILFPPFYAGSLEVQSRLLIDRPPASAR